MGRHPRRSAGYGSDSSTDGVKQSSTPDRTSVPGPGGSTTPTLSEELYPSDGDTICNTPTPGDSFDQDRRNSCHCSDEDIDDNASCSPLQRPTLSKHITTVECPEAISSRSDTADSHSYLGYDDLKSRATSSTAPLPAMTLVDYRIPEPQYGLHVGGRVTVWITESQAKRAFPQEVQLFHDRTGILCGGKRKGSLKASVDPETPRGRPRKRARED